MVVTKTRHGLRLAQHGVVISELRTSPGPTHSVFDVLAAILVAACAVPKFAGPGRDTAVRLPAKQPPRVAMLGFAGGGMMAPLRALGHVAQFEACDLDRPAYELFKRHCPDWKDQVHWHHADAMAWLTGQAGKFDIVVEDLSVPVEDDVRKPPVCWRELPRVIRRRLHRRGVAIFNLLPPGRTWRRREDEFEGLSALFPGARQVELADFENRILVAGSDVPEARELGRILRQWLARMGSRQAGRLRVRTAARAAAA